VGNAETNAVRIARVRAEVTLVGRNRRFKHATDHAHQRAGIFVNECPLARFSMTAGRGAWCPVKSFG